MAQFVFEPDPQGSRITGVVRSYAWATISRPPAAPHLHWCGHVRDVVVKVDGSWRIRSKQIMGWAGEVLARFVTRDDEVRYGIQTLGQKKRDRLCDVSR